MYDIHVYKKCQKTYIENTKENVKSWGAQPVYNIFLQYSN